MFGLSSACTATLQSDMIYIGTSVNVDVTENCDPRTMFGGDTESFQTATGCFCEDGSCQILMECTLADLLCAVESPGKTNLQNFLHRELRSKRLTVVNRKIAIYGPPQAPKTNR